MLYIKNEKWQGNKFCGRMQHCLSSLTSLSFIKIALVVAEQLSYNHVINHVRCLQVRTTNNILYENLSLIEIYRRIKNVHSESTINIQHVRKWYKKFNSGCENIVNESCSGRPISIADRTLKNKVDTIIQCDRKARLFNIAYQVNMTHSTVQKIIIKKLTY